MIAILVAALFSAGQTTPFETGRYRPLTAGDWTYLPLPSGSEARYGMSFRIRCDRAARRVHLSRLDAVQGAAVLVNISTDSLTRALPADGWLSARDPLLDSIAFSRGRFAVSGRGGVDLQLPTWPEAARSIEDCRN